MKIGDAVLIPGETLQLSKRSNAVIALADYGLKRLPYDQLTSMMGFSGKEAIGGKLHLTNFRVIFKSHPFNRCTGTFSIWLPTVHDVRDTSSFVVKKVCVSTRSQNIEFVLWGAQSFSQVVTSACKLLGEEQVRNLANHVKSDPEKLSTGSMISKGMEHIIRRPEHIVGNIVEICEDPISLSAVLNVIELIETFANDSK